MYPLRNHREAPLRLLHVHQAQISPAFHGIILSRTLSAC